MISKLIFLIKYLFRPRTFGMARGKDWSKTQKEHLILEPDCQCCGAVGKMLFGILNALNVHHIIPFHEHPELENDHKNLITLCRICHFLFGHLKCWASHNPNIREDAAAMRLKIKNRPL